VDGRAGGSGSGGGGGGGGMMMWDRGGMILHELASPTDVQLSEARALTYTYWSGSEEDDSRLRWR